MGEAKTRGTFEERKAEAVEKKEKVAEEGDAIKIGIVGHPTKALSIQVMAIMAALNATNKKVT